jgi:hypothetical protein
MTFAVAETPRRGSKKVLAQAEMLYDNLVQRELIHARIDLE